MNKIGRTIIAKYKGKGAALGVEKAAEIVDEHVTFELNENQWAALVCFVDNIGMASFIGSKLLQYLNNGWIDPSKEPNVPDEILLWTVWDNKQYKAMVERREAERALFVRPVLIQNKG